LDDVTPHVVSVGPDHKLADALQMMKTYGLSQLPVLEDGKSVGSVREGRLMAKLLDNRDLLQSPVSEVMDRALPVVNEDMSVETAVKYLKSSPALLVEEYGRIVGIVTRQDVLDIQS
jgi:cystathionine beta-synthase